MLSSGVISAAGEDARACWLLDGARWWRGMLLWVQLTAIISFYLRAGVSELFLFPFFFSLFSFLCRESFRYDFDSLIIEWIYFPAVLSLARGYTCTQRPQLACALTQHRTCPPLARSPCRATAGSQLGDNQPRSARFICTPSAGTISIFLRNGCFWRKSVQWAKKHLSLEIERSGACGYWPSSFSSAFWMVSCVLLYYY